MPPRLPPPAALKGNPANKWGGAIDDSCPAGTYWQGRGLGCAGPWLEGSDVVGSQCTADRAAVDLGHGSALRAGFGVLLPLRQSGEDTDRLARRPTCPLRPDHLAGARVAADVRRRGRLAARSGEAAGRRGR